MSPDQCAQRIGKIMLIRELIEKGHREEVEVYGYLFETLYPLYCGYCKEIGVEPESFDKLYEKQS